MKTTSPRRTATPVNASTPGPAPAPPVLRLVPAPVSVPLRSLLPPRPLAVGLLVTGVAAFAVSALRPKALPPQVQKAADVVSLVVVSAHPVETFAVSRLLKRQHVTPGVRRTTLASTSVFGVFGAIPALRAIRRATRAAAGPRARRSRRSQAQPLG